MREKESKPRLVQASTWTRVPPTRARNPGMRRFRDYEDRCLGNMQVWVSSACLTGASKDLPPPCQSMVIAGFFLMFCLFLVRTPPCPHVWLVLIPKSLLMVSSHQNLSLLCCSKPFPSGVFSGLCVPGRLSYGCFLECLWVPMSPL